MQWRPTRTRRFFIVRWRVSKANAASAICKENYITTDLSTSFSIVTVILLMQCPPPGTRHSLSCAAASAMHTQRLRCARGLTRVRACFDFLCDEHYIWVHPFMQWRYTCRHPTCWIDIHVFLWYSHINTNTVFRLVNPVYNMDTYLFKVTVFTKQAKYE